MNDFYEKHFEANNRDKNIQVTYNLTGINCRIGNYRKGCGIY